jgi:hypothetical protein
LSGCLIPRARLWRATYSMHLLKKFIVLEHALRAYGAERMF